MLAKGSALEIPAGFGSQKPEVRSQKPRAELMASRSLNGKANAKLYRSIPVYALRLQNLSVKLQELKGKIGVPAPHLVTLAVYQDFVKA